MNYRTILKRPCRKVASLYLGGVYGLEGPVNYTHGHKHPLWLDMARSTSSDLTDKLPHSTVSRPLGR